VEEMLTRMIVNYYDFATAGIRIGILATLAMHFWISLYFGKKRVKSVRVKKSPRQKERIGHGPQRAAQ
jgi:hypothetical protein